MHAILIFLDLKRIDFEIKGHISSNIRVGLYQVDRALIQQMRAVAANFKEKPKHIIVTALDIECFFRAQQQACFVNYRVKITKKIREIFFNYSTFCILGQFDC